jgi:hypothetical protein
LLFNRIIGSIQSLQVIWTVSHFMPCVWSQVSKKMSMKISCNFQAKSTGFCATIRTSLWRRSDAPQCLAYYIEVVRTTEQHLPDARSIIILHGVGFQKSTLLWKSLHVVLTTWQHVWALSNISEYSNVLLVRVKSILGVGPKVKDSIKDPFK